MSSSNTSELTVYTDARSHISSSPDLADVIGMHRRAKMAGFSKSPFLPEDRHEFLVLQRHALAFGIKNTEKRLATLEHGERAGRAQEAQLRVQPKDNLSCVLALPTSFNNSQVKGTRDTPARWPTAQELQAKGRPRVLPNPSQFLHLENKILHQLGDSAYWEWPLPRGAVPVESMPAQDSLVFQSTIHSMETLLTEISRDDAWKE